MTGDRQGENNSSEEGGGEIDLNWEKGRGVGGLEKLRGGIKQKGSNAVISREENEGETGGNSIR